MKARNKGFILLVVDIVVILAVVFGFRAWLKAIPEKETVEVPISSEIEEEIRKAGFGDRFAYVPLVRNYEKEVINRLFGAGVGIALGTTEHPATDHNQFVDLYLDPRNHYRNELILVAEVLTDEETNDFISEKQHFGFVKYYAVRSENGGNLMFIKDVYRYEERISDYKERFNIEKITEDKKILFVYNPGEGHIITMIWFGILIFVIGVAINGSLLCKWFPYQSK